MFDLSFAELLVIAVVALVVLGPERLPKVARTAGHLLGRLQRYVNDVKSDIQREMRLEELKQLQQQVEQQARDFESNVRDQASTLESDLNEAAAGVREAVSPAERIAPPAEKPEEGGGAAAAPDPQLELGLTDTPAKAPVEKA